MWKLSGDFFSYDGSCVIIVRNLISKSAFHVYSQYLLAKQPIPTGKLLYWMENTTSLEADKFLTKYWQHATRGAS